ncbi:MAG: hypothetical protein R3C05_04445 [Pirellulaceae bacterium]
MTIQRRIRHAILGFIAAFMLVVVFVPRQEPRTVWAIRGDAAHNEEKRVVAQGLGTEPIVAGSRLPEMLTARLHWRLLMTQHYADQELRRSTVEANDAMHGHLYWQKQYAAAADAYERLQALNKPTAIATPIAHIPGMPTRSGIMIAAFCGLLAAFLMVIMDKVTERKSSIALLADDTVSLCLPKSWFDVQPSLAQRFARITRAGCLLAIVFASVWMMRTSMLPSASDLYADGSIAEVASN